jgi:hypothetical protein
MLIIVHYGDIELIFEPLFDLETAWSSYIFEIDPSETISDIFHRCYKFIDILRPDDDRECVYSCKLLEEDTFPFHDWHTCFMAEISESEYR